MIENRLPSRCRCKYLPFLRNIPPRRESPLHLLHATRPTQLSTLVRSDRHNGERVLSPGFKPGLLSHLSSFVEFVELWDGEKVSCLVRQYLVIIVYLLIIITVSSVIISWAAGVSPANYSRIIITTLSHILPQQGLLSQHLVIIFLSSTKTWKCPLQADCLHKKMTVGNNHN